MPAQFIALNDGNKMPTIGLNTWNINSNDISCSIRAAIDVGFRLIDTSTMNGNEEQVGRVIKELLKSGAITRSAIFITTKLPPTANKPENIEDALLQSLSRLQLDYVDLYLVHAPIGLETDDEMDVIKFNKDGCVCLDNTTDHIKIWKKMEDLVLKGLTKSIGLSNFNQKQIERIVTQSTILPAVLQIEYHIYLQQPALIKYCRGLNIIVNSYAPLGAVDIFFSMDASTGMKRQLPNLMDDAEVKEIASKYGKTESQVLLCWLLQKNMSFLLRMGNKSRMLEIMEASKFQLNGEDVDILNKLDRNFRYVDLKFLKGIENHPEYPF